MLERVRYWEPDRGIHVEAFTDGYAYDDYRRVYLLSAAGRESSVKAVTSALLGGRHVDILSDQIVSVSKSYGDKYRVLSSKLPSGMLQQVTLSERFSKPDGERERLIYVPEGRDVAAAVYEAVRESCPVPLVSDWSGWLYERMREMRALEELAGTRTVVRLRADEELLDELVSEGVRAGEIGF